MRSLAILTPVLGNHAARPWPSCSPLPSLLGLLASLPRFTPASASVPVPTSARFATFQQPSTGAVPVSRQSPRSPRHTPQHHPQSVHPVISVTTVTNTLAALALSCEIRPRPVAWGGRVAACAPYFMRPRCSTGACTTWPPSSTGAGSWKAAKPAIWPPSNTMQLPGRSCASFAAQYRRQIPLLRCKLSHVSLLRWQSWQSCQPSGRDWPNPPPDPWQPSSIWQPYIMAPPAWPSGLLPRQAR
jgi:hypothetical protein